MHKHLAIALIATSLLTACLPQAESPGDVAQQYWDALQAGDIETAKQHVSSGTQQDLEQYLALPDEKKLPLRGIHIGEQKTTVTTIMHPADALGDDHLMFDTVLVLEKGKWKVDAGRTQVPAPRSPSQKELDELTGQLSDSMHDNLESIDEAVTESMKTLNQMLREGSSEMGQSMLRGMEELNHKLRESIDQMKQRRQQDSTINEDEGEGMI